MNKVMKLVRIQLWAVLGDMLAIGNNKKKKPKLLYAGVLFFVLLMSSVSFFYSLMIGSGLKLYDSLDILPAMMMSVTCIIVLFTTIFKVKGIIFGFRDYDLVMALPVSTGTIVASRLIIFYAINFIFVIIMMIPAMIAYGILGQPEMTFYLYGMIGIFFMPLVPIVLASFIGTLIAYAASKFRYSNLLNIIFSLGLLTVVIGVSFTIKDNGQELVNMSRALTDQVNSIYPLAQLFTDAVINYDITAFILFLVISATAFSMYVLIIRGIFKKMNSAIMAGRSRVNYKMGELKTSTPFKALFVKELKRYFASPIYVLNTGVGIIMLTLGSVASLFVDIKQVLGNAQGGADMMITAVPVFIVFCIVMTCTTMASISLEGKNLWIMKSTPIPPKTFYLSKAAVNLIIISPALIDVILLGIGLKAGVLQTLIMLLLTIVCAIFISLFGLINNLMMPNFNWSSEVIVVKQSAACLVTIFAGFGFIGILVLLMVFLPSFTAAYISYIIFMIIIDLVLYRIIMTFGKKRFYMLH